MNQIVNKVCTAWRIILIRAGIIACAFALLESCTCDRVLYCNNPAVCGDQIRTDRTSVVDGDKNWREAEHCQFYIFNMLYTMRFGSSIPIDSSRTGDAVAQANTIDSSRQSKSPKIIDGPKLGEYFSTTLTAGPLLNFKSSNEEYGGGYGEHKPGVGFHIGIGTVLPFSQHWSVAPSLRFTQKNASEQMSYSEPGGSGSMEYKDSYSYSYVGGTLLAQFRASKQISLVAGPEVNYLVAASVKNGGSSGTGEKQSLNENSQKAGLDVLAGVKYEIPSKNGRRSKWD